MITTDKNIDLVKKYRDKTTFLIMYTVFVAAIIMFLLVIALVVDVIDFGKVIKLEVGSELPSAVEISGKSDARYEYDENEIDISRVGNYKIHIVYGKNKKIKIRLRVLDTQAPKAVVKALSLHQGSSVLPDAEDFFEKISEPSKYTAAFVNAPKLDGLGTYEISIALEDEYGNRRIYDTTLSVIIDTESPKIYAPSSIVGYIGEGIAYKTGVSVSDNCFGTKLEVDASEVDSTKEGTYTVTFIASDMAGNKVSAIIPVYIHNVHITEEMLNDKIADIARREGMSKTFSKEELCKLIYSYVNDPTSGASSARFQYVGNSNDATRSDWRREAWLTIQNGQGDCYSYFALSKAFFEYFGIDNRDIERTKGLTNGETHFWSMVNIGSETNPRWYFFDATRYAGRFTVGGNNGCLMTTAQIKSYVPSKWGYEASKYYTFNAESYPKVCDDEINGNYVWR